MSKSRRLMRTRWLLVALVLLASSCGSTVRVTSSAGNLVGNAELGESDGVTAGGTGRVARARAGRAQTFASDGPGAAPGIAARRPAGARSLYGRGVTEREILIGLFSYDNSAALAAFGATGVYGGNPRDHATALVAEMNARGGIAGRRIRLVIYDVQDSEYGAGAEQAACARFTQDNHVFAVIATTETTATVLARCLTTAGVPLINTASGIGDSATYRTFPVMYDTAALELGAAGRLLVDGLAAQGYYKPSPAKYGLIALDNPPTRRVIKDVITPALRERGVTLSDVFLFCCENEDAPKIGNAVLRFKSANIDHVLTFGTEGGGLELVWMTSSESAAYHPRYGMTSYACGGCQTQLAPDAQLVDSVLVGWAPLSDIGAAASGVQLPPAFAECVATMARRGVDTSGEGQKAAVASACDRFYFLRAGVLAGLPDITLQSFARGVASLNTSFRSSVVYATRWSAGRHDGVAGWRPHIYDPSADRYKYTGGLRRL